LPFTKKEHYKNIMIRPLHPECFQILHEQAIKLGMLEENLVTFGTDAIDSRIKGGLAQRALHEVFAASVEDGSSAAAFAIMIGMRACPAHRPIIWVREHRCGRHMGHIHATGLAELGIDPNDLVLVDAPDTLAVLRAGADIVKCGEVGVVVIELWGKAPLLDLTASRRLSMGAAASGVLTLVLRVDAEPMPSAAQTRWQISAAPSSPLAANAPGRPALNIALLRHRGGIAGFETCLEWNRDTRSFAPLSGCVPAAPALRADQKRKAA
jgi:protein ImuA